MAEYISVYCTFDGLEKAEEIGRALVEEGLVACVNMIPAVHSIHKWKGKMESTFESAFFAKTKKSLFPKVKDRILEMHNYEIPCIVSLDIADGDEKFLGWIDKETINP